VRLTPESLCGIDRILQGGHCSRLSLAFFMESKYNL
jgi:hypothetical protein